MPKTDPYIIVVEVDNKRSLAAFQNGLDDLDVVFPQMMARAQEIDDEVVRKDAEEAAIFAARQAEWISKQQAYDDYVEARKKYDAIPWLQRSSKPSPIEVPKPIPGEYFDVVKPYGWGECVGLKIRYPKHPIAVGRLKSFRDELVKFRNTASAANAPYRMVESDALTMIAWENGEALERAKKRFLAE